MHGHPVQGIKGAKAKKLENGKSRSKNGPESGKPRLSSRPGARIAQLLEEDSSAEAIKQDIVALLHDLANLPGQISDPDWMAKIDPDFRAQVDVPPEPRTPGELKAEQAKAKRRRKAKIETMRKLRAKRP